MASEPSRRLNVSQVSPSGMRGVNGTSATPRLKRPLSTTHDDEELTDRKRLKEDMALSNSGNDLKDTSTIVVNGDALADDLAQELMCPCCSDLVYKPVVILPCDHISCGSCLTLWIKVSTQPQE